MRQKREKKGLKKKVVVEAKKSLKTSSFSKKKKQGIKASLLKRNLALFFKKIRDYRRKIEDFLFHFSVQKLIPALFGVLRKHFTEFSLHRAWRLLRFFGALGVLLAALLCIFVLHSDVALLRPINLYDEGVTLFGAKRFLSGEIPYRDFWTIYGPLKFPLLAGAFSLFGTSIEVARSFFLGVSLIAYALIFILLARRAGAIFAGVSVLFLASFGLFSLTPFFLTALVLVFSFVANNLGGKIAPFLLGGLIGLLLLLRIDFGLLSGGAIFCAVSFLCSFQKSRQYFFPLLGKIALAFFAVVIPPFVLLAAAGALPDFWAQAVSFPLFGEYQVLRELPWISPDFSGVASEFSVDFLTLSRDFERIFYLIPFGVSAVFWIFLLGKKKKSFPRTLFAENAIVAVFTFGAFLYASHRADAGHLLFLNAIALVFLLHTLSFFQKKTTTLLFLPFVVLLSLAPASDLLSERTALKNAEYTQYSFFKMPFLKSPENDNLQKTLDFFAEIPAEEKVFVGTSDTSRVFVNNIVLPFLLNQKPATKYHELHTGIVTTAPIQNEMIDEMREVQWAVMWDEFLCEENKSCISTEVFLFDDFFQANFEPVASFGKYRIFQRKEGVSMQ